MTTKLISGITITETAHETALYCKFDRQVNPQDCYIWLDPRDNTMGASYNGEIGNAVPEEVWHNRVLRYDLGGPVRGTAADKLMEHIAPLAARVCAGFRDHWDGSNYVGRYNDDAMAAGEAIEREIGSWLDAEDYLRVYSCSEWFGEQSAEELGLRRGMSDEEIEALATTLEPDCYDECDILSDDLAEYLRGRAEDMSAEEATHDTN